MRASTIFAGFVGGVALALTLAAPLYVGLPGRYLPEWAYMTVQGSMWGFLGALLALVGTGVLAAFLDPESPVVSGTLAGTFAAVVGGLLMVLPATALEAVSDVINQVESGGTARLDELVAHAMVSAAWLPSATGLLVIGAGPAFGAMGGVGWDLTQPAPPTSGTRPSTWTVIPMVGLLAAAVWAAVVPIGLRLATTTHADLEMALTNADQLKLTVPLGTLALAVGALLAWAVRDAMLLYRDGRRLRGALWGAASAGLALVILAEAVVLFPDALTSPVLWGAVGIAVVATLVSVARATRADVFLKKQPATLSDLVAQGLLGSVAIVAPGLYGGGTAAIAIGVVALPWLAAVGGGPEPIASSLLVTRVYQIHWVAGLLLLMLTLIGVLAAVPLWLYGRSRGGR